jgi:hypothetical protein
MAPAQVAPAPTDALAPSLEATWAAAAPSHHPTDPLARALEVRWEAVVPRDSIAASSAEAVASDPEEGTSVADGPERDEGAEIDLDGRAAPQGGLRRFRRPRVPSTVPGPYPSLQDARACGLFV